METRSTKRKHDHDISNQRQTRQRSGSVDARKNEKKGGKKSAISIDTRKEMFLECCKKGDLAACKALVEGCSDDERKELMNAVKEDRWTVLHHASWNGHREVIRWILWDKKGGGRRAGFNSLMRRGIALQSALHLAARNGHLECCKALVDGCRDEKERRKLFGLLNVNNWTALQYASYEGHVDIVRWILTDRKQGGGGAGFELLRATVYGCDTAMHLAAAYGHWECCKALVDTRRNAEERKELLNARGGDFKTILHCASSEGHVEVIQWILSDKKGGGRRAGFDSLLATDEDSDSALHVAARNGHLECCKALVDGCRDDGERKKLLNAVGGRWRKRTLLQCAYSNGRLDVFRWLLSNDKGGRRRVGFESLMARDEEHGDTVLHRAVRDGRLEYCKALVEGCRDSDERKELLNVVNNGGRKVLHYAAWYGHCDIVQWLVSDKTEEGHRAGFDLLMQKDNNQETALHVAARNGHLDCCKALLDACQDSAQRSSLLRAVNHKGRTILHIASSRRSIDCIKWIVRSPETHFLLNLKDKEGFTALHLAAESAYDEDSQCDAVKALLFEDDDEEDIKIDKDRKRIATMVDPNIGCGLNWNR